MQLQKRDRIRAQNALEISKKTEQAVDRGRPADRELARIFRQNRRFGSHDRRLYSSAAFSLFRWRGWTGTLAKRGPEAELYALLLDAEELTPQICALAEIAEIDRDRLKPLGGLELGVKANALFEMGATSERPCYRSLVPEWIWDELPFSSAEREQEWVESIQNPLPVWMRIAGDDSESAIRFLEANGIATQTHPKLPTAVMTEHNISRALLAAKEAAGIHLQDLASQAVGLVCAPVSGQSWWDVCSGAGGKTLHLADIMRNEGSVLATDIRSETLRNLHKRLRRSAIGIVQTEKMEATDAVPKSAPFDGVLVDAPCSGAGTWARNPDARWRTDLQFAQKCADRQTRLLSNVASAVKPGGILVYAVCSPLKSETISTVAEFLSNHAEFLLDPFENPIDGSSCDGTCSIDSGNERTIGMFIARFKKIAE